MLSQVRQAVFFHRPQHSTMMVSAEIATKYASIVVVFGVPLWHHLKSFANSDANRQTYMQDGGMMDLTPRVIQQQVNAFASISEANAKFVKSYENRNIKSQLFALSKILTVHDDPLIISPSVVCNRCE